MLVFAGFYDSLAWATLVDHVDAIQIILSPHKSTQTDLTELVHWSKNSVFVYLVVLIVGCVYEHEVVFKLCSTLFYIKISYFCFEIPRGRNITLRESFIWIKGSFFIS